LCPKLQALAKTDGTIDELLVNIPDPNNLFPRFLSLGRCGELSFEESDRSFLLDLAKEFGNSDLYSKIFPRTAESPALSDIVSRLAFSTDDLAWSSSDVDFIAEHFDRMTMPLFSQISFEFAHAILSSQKLTLETEDALYSLLSSRFEEDDCFYELLDLVRFEYLSPGTIDHFVSRSAEMFEHLSFGLWSSICGRLSLPVKPERPNLRIGGIGVQSFEFKQTRELQGIIAGLTARSGANVHDCGIVTVSTSSSGEGSLRDIVDFSSESGLTLHTNRDASGRRGSTPWICYDFGDRRVKPIGCAIVFSDSVAQSFDRLLHISVHISEDGSAWRLLGTHKEFRKNTLFYTFPLRPGFPLAPPGVRFVRLMMDFRPQFLPDDGVTFSVAAWELYGEVRMNPGEKLKSGDVSDRTISTQSRPTEPAPVPARIPSIDGGLPPELHGNWSSFV
jgi:hypothetical protein